jgi:uncharacterized protein (TIRG00374 family)
LKPTSATPAAPAPSPGGAIRNLAIGLVVSAIFLYFTFRTVDLRKMAEAMRQVDGLMLGLATVCFGLHFVGRAVRWRVIVNPMRRVGVRSLLRATVVGFAANNVLPLRLGELVRALMLTITEGVPLGSAVTTVVLVRLLDMVALGTMFVVVLAVFPLPPNIRHAAMMAIPIYLLALAFLLGLKFREEEALKLLEALLRPLPAKIRAGVMKLVRAFLPGLESLRSAWELALAVALTHLAWAFIFAYNALVVIAFGFPLPWYAGLVLILVVGFAITIPSSPGYLGVYHLAVIAALGLFTGANLTEDAKTAFAIVVHGAQFLVTTAWGIGYMLVSPVGFAELAAALRRRA